MVNCLIDGDYTTKDDKPVLRLFYKNEEGSYVDEIEGFKPYFFAIAKDDVQALADDVIKIDGITDTEIVKKVDGNKEIDALKVIAVHPRLIRELRESVRLLPTCHQVREADIPYVRRYIIDSGIVPFAGAEDVGLRVAAIDCEIACVGQPDSSKDPVHMISYADSTGFRRVWFWGRGDVDLEYAKSCPDERSMIEALLKTVDEQEINILTGYNTDNFDFPYFEGRAEKLKMNLGFGFNNEKLRMERRGMNMGAKIVGRPHIDMYPVCRQVFNLPRYQLEDVYESLFGVEKLDIKVSQIREFYNSPDVGKFKII